MKRTVIGIVAVIMFAITVGLRGELEPKTASGSHLGTWQLASYKYGTNRQDFADFPSGQRRIKLITQTHFAWVQFDTATKLSQSIAGGSYSLSGDMYTESIDFADAGMAPYLGN